MRYCFSIKHLIIICIATLLINSCASDAEKKERFLTQADQAFKSQEYSKAKIHLKNALKLDPRFVKAYQLLAQTHLKLNEHQEAFSTYLKLETLDPGDLDAKIQLASIYFIGKRYKESRERIDAVLEKKPDNLEALYLRAAILAREDNDLDGATEIYKTIIALDASQVKAYMSLSGIQMARKEYKDAGTTIEKAIRTNPANIDLHKSLYQLYLIQNDLNGAEKVLLALSKDLPDSPEPFLMLGDFYLRRKNEPDAQKAFLQAIKNDPKNINALMLTAKFFNAVGKPGTAEEYIINALSIEPENIDILYAYADFHLSNKRIDKAEELVDSLLADRPKYSPARQLKGKIYATRNEFDKAIDIFNALLKEEPRSFMLHYLLASALMAKGEINQAKASFVRALEENPNLHKARLFLANIYFRERDFPLAMTQTEKILQDVPDEYNANILKGNILMAQKELDAAGTIFRRMILKDPENPAAYYRLGLLQRVLKNDDEAMRNFDKALAINSHLMDVFTNVIGIYAGQKQYDTALKRCDDHLALTGEEPIIQSIIINLKGDLYLSKNDPAAAEAEFNKAIKLNPEFIAPYMSLSRILTSQNKTEDTISVYKALIAKRPDQPSPYSLLGTLYEAQKKYDLAEEQYKKSLEINSEFIPAMNNLAYLYGRQDRELNKAFDLARRAREKVGDYPAVMDTLGWVYYKKGLYDNAIVEFDSCIEKEPDNPMFHYHLGLTLHKNGKSDAAKASLEKALDLSKDFEGADEAIKILSAL